MSSITSAIRRSRPQSPFRRAAILSLIAAVARNGVIGAAGRLPWRLPADLRRFRRKTLGKPVLMGRLTYESIGKPLPGRLNIVVTRDPEFSAPGCRVVHSIEEGLKAGTSSEEMVVIGGARLYESLLPRVDRIYLTRVQADVPGDAKFPELDPSEWSEVEREDHPADGEHPYAFTFLVLERRARPPPRRLSAEGRAPRPASSHLPGAFGKMWRGLVRLFLGRRFIRHPPRDPR